MDPRAQSCEKCGGSLGIDHDHTGVYITCLMCGRSSLVSAAQGMSFFQPNPVLSAEWPARPTPAFNPEQPERRANPCANSEAATENTPA